MAVTEYYRLGEVALLIATFTDESGDPVTPGGVEFSLTAPDGTVTPYTHAGNPDKVIEDSTGVYYVAWLTALRGPYEWRMVGTGANAGATGGKFRVH